MQEVFAKYFNNENFKNTQLFCKTLVTKTPLRSAPHRLRSGCATISTLNRDIMEPGVPSVPLSPPGSPAWTLFLSGTAACLIPCFSPFIWVPATASRGWAHLSLGATSSEDFLSCLAAAAAQTGHAGASFGEKFSFLGNAEGKKSLGPTNTWAPF